MNKFQTIVCIFVCIFLWTNTIVIAYSTDNNKIQSDISCDQTNNELLTYQKVTEKKFFPRNHWIFVGGTGPNNFSTIQAAVNTAQPGDSVFVYPGIYFEHVAINKKIQLIGAAMNTTIIDGSRTGIPVTITASDVTLFCFSVKNSISYGVYSSSAANTTIQHCNSYQNSLFGIYLYQSEQYLVQDCLSHHNQRYGIYLLCSPYGCLQNSIAYDNDNPAYHDHGIVVLSSSHTTITQCVSYNGYYGIYLDLSSECLIDNCTTYGNVGYGIHLMEGAHNTIQYCTSYNNSGFGIYVELSSSCIIRNCVSYQSLSGILLYSNAQDNEIIECTVFNNRWNGIYLRGISWNNSVTKCTIYDNPIGIEIFDRSGYNLMYHNNFYDNEQNAFNDGINFWDNGLEGNYWDDYTGMDADGDGIGDTPYIIAGSIQDHYPLMYPAGAPKYHLLDIGDPVQPSASCAYDVNEQGYVVGWCGEEYGFHEAFVWQNNILTKLGMLPDGLWSEARAINETDVVVGSSQAQACLWIDGSIFPLGSLGSESCVSYAYGINNQGQVVGTSYIEPNQWQPPHAFLWTEDNGMLDLGVLAGDTGSVAYAINDHGQVVGSSSMMTTEQSIAHGFIWDQINGMQLLEPDAVGNSCEAYAINNQGICVGISQTPDGVTKALAWNQNRDPVVLYSRSGIKNQAQGINDYGDIVGSFVPEIGSQQHAVLWKKQVLYDLNDLIVNPMNWKVLEVYTITNTGLIAGKAMNEQGDVHAVLLQPYGLFEGKNQI